MEHLKTYDIFSEEFCDLVCHEYSKLEELEVVDEEGFYRTELSSENCPANMKAFYLQLMLHVESVCRDYISSYVLMPKYELGPHITFFRYKPGQSTEMHIDYGGEHSIAALLYLNTLRSGGETVFPLQNIRSEAEAGKLVVFPMNYTYPHESLPHSDECDRLVVRFSYYPLEKKICSQNSKQSY